MLSLITSLLPLPIPPHHPIFLPPHLLPTIKSLVWSD